MRKVLASLHGGDFIEIPMSKLKVFTLNVTESCDAACLYCHWWKEQGHAEPVPDLARAVDQAAAMGVSAIRLSGGEPLLRPDLPELVAHIRNRGLVSMVCTAAKCDIQLLIKLIDAGLDVFSISIDTLDHELFYKLRGYRLGPVLENLRRLVECRQQKNFEIVLSIVVSRLSVAGLNQVLQHALDRNLVVSITPFQDAALDHGSAMSVLAFQHEDREMLQIAMAQVRDAAHAGLRVINSDDYLSGIADFCITHRLPQGYMCRAGDHGAIRMAGGALKLCHSLDGLQGADLVTVLCSDAATVLRQRMARLECPGCWLSCHADSRRPVRHCYGRPEIWDAL